MSDLDLSEFFDETGTRGYGCWHQKIQISSDQKEKLDAAMLNEDISNPAISRVLKRWGVEVGHSAVRNHRLGECRCG